MSAIVLFDGVCNLCNASVQFVIDRDPKAHFLFCAQQSAAGEALMKQHGLALKSEPESVLLIEGSRVSHRSTAALQIAKKLSGGWPLLYGLIIVPTFLRDVMYGFIARNRYRWFGRQASCRMPTADLRRRFIEDPP